MKTLRCLVADDEPIARKIVENYIAEIPNLELIASCKDAFEVMEKLQNEEVDILFLDINMPKLTGIGLLKTIKIQPEVIITTAYPEYALEGFELSVTDYLLKPFSLERFLQAVLKVQQKSQVEKTASIPQKENDNTSIFVKSDKKLIKLDFNDISHAEAYGNYVKVFADTMILTPQTLSDFLDKLPSSFIRVHKSYVINFNALQLIDGNLITLQNGTKVPMGKSYRKAVLDRI